MDSGTKCKKSPQQAEENDDDQAGPHAHASDYSIWNIRDRSLRVEGLESVFTSKKKEPEIARGHAVNINKRFIT